MSSQVMSNPKNRRRIVNINLPDRILSKLSIFFSGPCSNLNFSWTDFGNKGVKSFANAPKSGGRFNRSVGPDSAGYYILIQFCLENILN